jgi:prepilin peptidase CpaA
MTRESVWILTAFFAVWAGILDWRYKRIPNWLTVAGLVAGIGANAVVAGWPGAKGSLLGAGLGLLVLLPLVLLRALGGGDWKLIGALGALLGPGRLVDVLIAALIVAGVMAAVLVIAKGRVRETLRNIANLVRSLLLFRMPGPEVSLDNPNSVRIPFGVAVAVAAVLYSGTELWRMSGRTP